MPLSYLQLVKNLSTQLNQYDPIEAETLVNWLLEHHLGMRRVDMMNFLEEKDLPEALKRDFERLKTGEPIQYILGHGPFYGREFKVSPATLIPRNETEELVHLIIKENPQPKLRILDIGTGTGCVPITLALEMQEPEVFGVDISEEALEIATFNAKKLKADVTFSKCDILLETPKLTGLDILVSNPPYIPIEEKKLMHQNVLDFEPHLALFVSDGDPLIFYKKIAETGMKLLKPFGKIYFEINERYGSNIADLLSESGYNKVRVIQDLNGKDRIVSGQISK
ncbi:peptide chain release factor N(5)-glutamine methyltransferase [Algoriphagus sp.]|jgi:release factor glutamine methyltransferase|uniref:peptide chain release factor N(5)-glutamine methyltransferase n=1 Tax=Algoriphagus sp. TaxID=1872435 RepID=UPI002726E7FF|nr:peptide chain release factor N(5)-glutamine methyltransferase [Algoriphagus sp.]MDO8967146.1 peptide chain release factor N(5)-glutamine methyltransferase [Algoriphagus sp.]MDP3200882.1 peptide chain release factor N(5)-glutamine methyltransferase [Algoriphagus sp.]